MRGHLLMAWEDTLPAATEQQIVETGRRIAAAMV
jgi:hypothetical protein